MPLHMMYRILCVVFFTWMAHARRRHAPTRAPVRLPSIPTSPWWEVTSTHYNVTGTVLSLRTIKSTDTIHSCYEYKVNDKVTSQIVKSNTFCYPSMVLVGYKKCSTSALYALITQHPQIIEDVTGKENCPFEERRTLDQYFDSLPRTGTKDRMIVNGCIYPTKMMAMAEILRNPHTFYLVIVRDYADWLWSAYNYWCDPSYDKGCPPNHWITPGVHQRSAEAFAGMVLDSAAGREVVGPSMMHHSCDQASTQYSSFMQSIWDKVGVENTLVLASEDLEAHPGRVWVRIARVTGLNPRHPSVNAFEKVRYNTNEVKGTKSSLQTKDYRKGVYAASNYSAVLDSSREVLNKCWLWDCQFVVRATGHKYEACQGTKSSPRTIDAYLSKYLATVANSSHSSSFFRSHRQLSPSALRSNGVAVRTN